VAKCFDVGGVGEKPNTTLELTVQNRGRPVLAMDCVLARAQGRSWPAAQLNR
jgi:hypothetical protein